MKLILLALLSLMLISSAYSQFGAVGSAKSVAEDQEDQLDKAFVMKGWLRFFTYTPSFYASSIPNKFEYNPGHQAQFSWGRNPTFTDKDKDEWGFFNIPDDTHFFFVLTKKTLYAMNARRVIFITNFSFFNAPSILPEARFIYLGSLGISNAGSVIP